MALFELCNAWLARLISFLLWANFYFYTIKQLPDRSPEWCSRVITLFHGSVAAFFGYRQCEVVVTRHACWEAFTRKLHPSQYALMLWSWGYFAFDLLWCLVYWPSAKLMLCHHICSVAAITIYMYQDYTGCTFACALALMEVTNPLVQIRWFLKQEGYAGSYVFLFIEVVYLAMFFFLRGVLGSYIVFWIFKTECFDINQKVITLALYIVSIGFLYDIIGYILHKYKREINIGFTRFSEFCNTTSLSFYEYSTSHTDSTCHQEFIQLVNNLD